MIIDYATAKSIRDFAERNAAEAGATLQQFPKGAMGLTPDSVKATPEWRKAKAQYEVAAQQLRNANAYMVKHYRAEMAAERAARRAG